MPSESEPSMKSHHLLLLRVVAVTVVLMGAKVAAHYFNVEIITINPLFTGIIAANVFLMGFLLSGVLTTSRREFPWRTP